MLGYVAARTNRIILSTATTLITTNDPVKIAEDYAMLQHLAGGRVDLMLGRGNTGPVYPWFGQDIRNGIALATENYALLHGLWREDVVDWEGKFRTPLTGFTSTPRPLDGVPPSCGTAPSGAPRSQNKPPTTATASSTTTSSGRRSTPSGWCGSIGSVSSTTATARPTRRSSGSADRCSCVPNSQDAVREFRPYFDKAPVYGGGPSLEDFMAQTPSPSGVPRRSSTGR